MGKQNFILVNKTGHNISEVYVSPSGASEREENVVTPDTIVENDAALITHLSLA